MRSRIIVSSNGQTLVARGNEYVAPERSGMTVVTSRQFDEARPENRTYRAMRNNGDALERAWIYGNPRAVSKSELKRAARLEKARSLPTISPAEAIAMIEAMKRADEAKAKLAAREKERAEEARREELEEAKEARRKVAEARLSTLRSLNKSA
jgi:hypothetical protein